MGIIAIIAGAACGVAVAALISRTIGLYNVRGSQMADIANRADDTAPQRGHLV